MGKRLVQGVALLAIFLLMPVSLIGIWVRQEVADTDAYVASVQDLPANPDVQEAIVQLVGNRVDATASQSWESFVTATVDNATLRRQLVALNVTPRRFVEDQTRMLLQQPEITSIWIAINRSAHPVIRNVLLGNDTAAVSGVDGDIRINIGPIYDALVARLAGQGIDVTRVLPAQTGDMTLTIYDSPSLKTTQRVTRLIDRWALPAAVIAGVLALLVLVISQRKALAGAVLGLVAVLSMAVSLVGLSLAIRYALDRDMDPVQQAAARAIVREVTASLREWALIVGAVGAVVMVVCLVVQSLGRHQTRAVYRR
ncbi:MAG: hypothetical protein WBA46_00590 [Thermomicrobiales bacterium]